MSYLLNSHVVLNNGARRLASAARSTGACMTYEANKPGDSVTIDPGEDYLELRRSVRRVCEGYPGRYWRELDDQSAYPTEFIMELTNSGFLAALIPEAYGGAGLPLRAAAVILEEINASG